MKTLLIIATFFIATACNSSYETKAEKTNPFQLTCSNVGSNIVRCENKETICYAGSAGYHDLVMGKAGIQCKFKEDK